MRCREQSDVWKVGRRRNLRTRIERLIHRKLHVALPTANLQVKKFNLARRDSSSSSSSNPDIAKQHIRQRDGVAIADGSEGVLLEACSNRAHQTQPDALLIDSPCRGRANSRAQSHGDSAAGRARAPHRRGIGALLKNLQEENDDCSRTCV